MVNRTLDVRWIRRYRLFYICGCVILAIQVFLAYIFIHTDNNYDNGTQEQLSGKGKLNVEVLDDRNSVESSRRFRESYLGVDDEEDDNLGNSNAVYIRVKVPPDKFNTNPKQYNKVPVRSNNSAVKAFEGSKSLRLEELDFAPGCNITGREAISAINRARTQYCKQLIANTTCLMINNELYPTELPHSCPAPGMKKGKPLGCYQDDKSSRLLPGFYSNLRSINAPANCINLCLQSGFPYAGVQYRTECFCGNDEPVSSAKLPDSSCHMKCPGDPKETCGGYYTMGIYQTGVARLELGVAREVAENGSPSPYQVRIVFLLTLNGRAVRQVKRLIKALFHRDHFFYIHVDARQEYMARELSNLELRLRNVRLSSRREATIWGGASLLTILLRAMEDLDNSAWEWDFLVNLSESDFPVKTNKQLVEFLAANRDKNFVKSHGREGQRFIQKQGLDKSFVECEAHMWRVGDRSLPWGIVVDGGSDWLALSRPFVHYLVSNPLDPLINGLKKVFKHTLLPAESFFHSALRNSEFCKSYVDNNLHVTNWRRRLGCKCQYKHVVDWCGCSPNNFKLEDWTRLQGTEGKSLFFARKFEASISQSIINKLDEWLNGPYPPSIPGLDSYWESEYEDLDKGGDDTLITLGRSLSRMANRHQIDSNCIGLLERLVSVTTYHHSDKYMGSLVKYVIGIKEKEKKILIKFESWVKPKEYFNIIKSNSPGSRFKWLIVSSDYDQKEQLSRNQLRWLGPMSEPYAIYEYGPPISVKGGGTNHSATNLTLLWVDPIGAIADVTHIAFDDIPGVSFSKPILKQPLLPGAWEVKVIWGSTLVAQSIFLVLPLEFISKSPLTHQQAFLMHQGPNHRYPMFDIEWNKFVHGGKKEGGALERRAVSNAKRVGLDLIMWIDSLVTKFFIVVDTCLVGEKSRYGLEICLKTPWSSLSPDPKTSINSIDKDTGRISRW